MAFDFDGAVHGLALNPDGTRLAAAGPGRGVVFDTSTGEVITEIRGATGHAYDVDFAPDGASVVICFHAGHVRRYDATNGEEIARYTGHGGVPDGVRKVKFRPDGQQLASVGEDATLRIWDAESTEELHCLDGRSDVNTVAWGPAEGQVTFATDVGLHRVDIEARRGLSRDTEPIAEVQIVDGQVISAWGDEIRIMTEDLEIEQELTQDSVARIRLGNAQLFAASWRGGDAGVHRWNLATGTRERLGMPEPVGDDPHPVWALALDPEAGRLYAGASPIKGPSSIVIWDACFSRS